MLNRWKWKWLTGIAPCLLLFMVCPSWATHPLATDDTGTQGKGKFQLELNGQFDWEKEEIEGVSVRSTGGQAAAALSYGIAQNVDLVLSLSYLWGKAGEDEPISHNERGIGDTVLEAKWRFFEKNGFGLALKPGISIPTGDSDKGLGTGRLGGRLFLIGTKALEPCALHANLGYIRNENKNDWHKDLWHVSGAVTWDVVKDLKLVANAGMERNPDNTGASDSAFLIGGVIYSFASNLDIDIGAKYDWNSSETEISLMAGMAFRF